MDRLERVECQGRFPESLFGVGVAKALSPAIANWIVGLKPFYQEAGITIFRGDCKKILPQIPPAFFDLLLTDPPYGINYDTNVHGTKGGGRHVYKPVKGDDQAFDPSHLLGYQNIVLWGANYYAHRLPQSKKWIVWDKRAGKGQNCQSDAELAWTKGLPGVATRALYHYWNGAIRASERGEPRHHPTQKPVALMRWVIESFPGVQSVIDPYMGVGTTLVAAKHLGVKAIGIEFDADYCRIAADRVSQTKQLLN